MKIIAEQLDVRDRSSRNVGVGEVAWEEDKGHIANVIRVSETVDVSDFEWRLPVGEENLGRVLDLRQPTRIHEFLHDLIGTRTSYERCNQAYLKKDFSKDAVCLFSEDCGEYDSDPVVGGLDIDGLLITIMDGHQISLP
jgi:hypothetical protein